LTTTTTTEAMVTLSNGGVSAVPVRNAPIPFLLTGAKKTKPQPLDLSSLAVATGTSARPLSAKDSNARSPRPLATTQPASPNNQRGWPSPATAITVELDIWSPTVRSARSPANFGPLHQADDASMQLDTPRTPNAPVTLLSRFKSQHANLFSVFQDNCRFEHPSANGSASANPFTVLSGNSNTNNNRGGFGRQPAAQSNQFSLSKDTIQKDLAEERPAWILSAYGPGRDAPEQLWGGYPIEQSFEEIRLHYMTGEASGNAQGAVGPAAFGPPG